MPILLWDMNELVCVVPENEAERSLALKRFEILDTPPDGSFDRITSLCARLFNVPIALVTLVDEDRIWFKSRYGLDAEQVDRDPGLCASAILDESVYVVEDAVVDPRTFANPLVAGAMGLRFYAAAPLRTHDGYGLGNLCIMDKEPRQFDQGQQQLLQELAGVVMDEMELRLAALNSMRKKDEFMAMASHELRTPLSTAKAFVELAEMTLPRTGNDDLITYVSKANRALDQISSLINDLMDVSRIQHGSVILRKEIVDLDALVWDVVENIQPTFATHRIEISGSTGQHVPADRDRLQQVIINLLTNAVKYSPGKNKVEVILSALNGYAVVTVKDEGIGIAKDQLTKIFERFHREKMVERGYHGLGVGLYIAADLTRRHGGKLSVESELGKGSRFHLSIPVAAA